MGEGRVERGGAESPRLVVGVGASVGGLSAFKRLLDVLPADAGLAVVLVQHLDPTQDSLLPELLESMTAMAVLEACDGARLKGDTVYVIPPGSSLAVVDGRIELAEPVVHHGVRLPIDHLFCSLAASYRSRAVGVVLSGNGSDGSAGVKEIHAVGGLTMVQEPMTSARTGMPRSAIDTGAVDLVLTIEDMPGALHRFEASPAIARASPRPGDTALDEAPPELSDSVLEHLASILQQRTGFDLRVYKKGTLERRVLRRMTLAGFDDIEAYGEHLGNDAAEPLALIRELLISVTSFFRDPEAFEVLEARVIRPLVEEARPGETLRVWVAGCATGEEAYSLAMEFSDAIERRGRDIGLQVFATDIDDDALAVARVGRYPASIRAHVSEARLEKYFTCVEGRGLQIRSSLRDKVSFAAHDLAKDPPFSRMDLVTCRNLLIYLRHSVQEHVLRVLHFALKKDRYLFLGSSESLGPVRALFTTKSKKWRLFRKVGSARPISLFPKSSRFEVGQREESTRSETGGRAMPLPRASSLSDAARQAILRTKVPPTVLVDSEGRILFMHGELRPYLKFPDGDPRLELAQVVSEDIATRTRAAFFKCRRDDSTVVSYSSPDGERGRRVKITADPAPDMGDGAVILSFEDASDDEASRDQENRIESQEGGLLAELERELRATREDLRSTVEELEFSNAELRSSNEESLTMNEELQSANEELEATTEELRSLNEELTAVNAQLREKVEQLEDAHDDIANFFGSTKIATVFLDQDLHIRRFTPAARELLGIDESDIGRFVGNFARELLQHELVADARRVLGDLSGRTQELQTADGRWIDRRLLPYRTSDRRIEGVVVTFVDVTELRAASERLAVRERQQAMIARLGLRALEEPELETFLARAVHEIQQTLGTDLCKVLELQPGGEHFFLRAGIGWREGVVQRATVSAGDESQAGFTARATEAVIVEDLKAEQRFCGPDLLFDHGVVSGLSCPIRSGSALYGVLGVHTRTRRVFTREDAYVLQSVAAVIAGAVHRHHARNRLAFESVVALAMKDANDLRGTVRRLQEGLSERLGLCLCELWSPTEDSRALNRASLFGASGVDASKLDQCLPGTPDIAARGVPSQVFEQRRARWVVFDEEDSFVRSDGARHMGLRSALAFPVIADSKVLGVVCVLFARRLHADAGLLHSLETMGRSIGDWVHRLDIEQRFRLTVDGAPVGIAERSLDGRWLRANERLCEITGYTRDELGTMSPDELTHPEDRGPEARMDAAVRERRSSRYESEKRLIAKNGKVVWISLSSSVVETPSGQAEYRVDVVEDISARKAAQEELRRSEARFRRVLRSSPVPLMMYDQAGNVLGLSESWTEVTGYEPRDIPTVETWVQKAFPSKTSEIRALLDARWGSQDGVCERELDVRTRSGAVRRMLLESVGLGTTVDGMELRMVAAADVTRERKSQRELLLASTRKDEFIAMLGHELRNPLAAVRSATELLEHSELAPQLLSRVQEVLQRQTRHMAKLLDGLLDLSRMVQGKIQVERKPVDLGLVVAGVVEDLRSRARAARIDLTIERPQDAVWVQGDGVRLTQVVDNLVSNALKYTPERGEVSVSLGVSDGQAVLEVRDTGDGIDADLLTEMFEPFRQGHQNLDRPSGGLGIGLSLVKQLVELHDGTVEARSEGRGRGAHFIVRLPLTSERPKADADFGRGEARANIVLIEDNEDAADMLQSVLESRGHVVSVAHTGAEGIEMTRAKHPDVVICDIGLPDSMSGFDVARALRNSPSTRGVRLVALSGYARSEDARQSFSAGFDVHLAKPVALEAVDRTLRELLAPKKSTT